MVRHVVSLLNGENTASTIIKQVTVVDAIRWHRASWDEVKLTKVQFVTFKKCGFSQLKSVTDKAQDDAEFQDLFQLLKTEVTAEGYLSFDDDVETHEEAIQEAITQHRKQ